MAFYPTGVQKQYGHHMERSLGLGVSPAPFFWGDICYVAHGASLGGARNGALQEVNRAHRCHTHVVDAAEMGISMAPNRMRSGTQSIAIVTANAARYAEINFICSRVILLPIWN